MAEKVGDKPIWDRSSWTFGRNGELGLNEHTVSEQLEEATRLQNRNAGDDNASRVIGLFFDFVPQRMLYWCVP